MADIKTVTLQDLLGRIKILEEKVRKLTGKEAKKDKPAPVTADIKTLLSQLKEADKKAAFKIRRQLRKAGYSLRDNNGK